MRKVKKHVSYTQDDMDGVRRYSKLVAHLSLVNPSSQKPHGAATDLILNVFTRKLSFRG